MSTPTDLERLLTGRTARQAGDLLRVSADLVRHWKARGSIPERYQRKVRALVQAPPELPDLAPVQLPERVLRPEEAAARASSASILAAHHHGEEHRRAQEALEAAAEVAAIHPFLKWPHLDREAPAGSGSLIWRTVRATWAKKALGPGQVLAYGGVSILRVAADAPGRDRRFPWSWEEADGVLFVLALGDAPIGDAGGTGCTWVDRAPSPYAQGSSAFIMGNADLGSIREVSRIASGRRRTYAESLTLATVGGS